MENVHVKKMLKATVSGEIYLCMYLVYMICTFIKYLKAVILKLYIYVPVVGHKLALVARGRIQQMFF